MGKKIKILTLNIGNPSYERAQKQIEWLEKRDEDVFVLTETKNSLGCNFMEAYFNEKINTVSKNKKYYVIFPKSTSKDLGVMAISKWPITRANFLFDEASEYYGRAIDFEIVYPNRKIRILGLYIPSRDRTEKKVIRKRRFIDDVVKYLSNRDNSFDIVCGDFNILERDHYPRYSTFFQWEYEFYDKLYELKYSDAYRIKNPMKDEYSWVGRTNNGYRYDHMFISKKIMNYAIECSYLHETRSNENKFTDHSAMKLDIILSERRS